MSVFPHDLNGFVNECVEEEFEESLIPKFRKSELSLGRFLGIGQFGAIRELVHVDLEKSSILNDNKENKDRTKNTEQVSCTIETKKCGDSEKSSAFEKKGKLTSTNDTHKHQEDINTQLRKIHLSKNTYRNSSSELGYAVKMIRRDLKDETRFQAVADLAIESCFLSKIRHPNIIRIRGIADTNPLEDEYFIIIDRLYETLDQRVENWKHEGTQMKFKFCLPNYRNGSVLDSKIIKDKFIAAFDLASAIEYMHSKRIMHRDIKPQNIGFDERNSIRLFDLGLAKELDPKSGLRDIFKNTGCAGSLRYMAPEVASSEKYGLSADVYSFGLVFWQMISTEVPYKGLNPVTHKNEVVSKNVRPKLQSGWSSNWRMLMKKCWTENISERITMKEAYINLGEECNRLCIKKRESAPKTKSPTPIF